MVKAELIKRSPLRVFEQSIHGGVGTGHIGIIASRKGVGKTACLTHIAVDKLFQNQRIIHVSFASNVDHIITWYEDIFQEIAKKRELEHAVEVHDEIVKNRVIMNFNQEGVETAQVLQSLEALIKDGKFEANTIIFDGYRVGSETGEDFKALREFAERLKLEIWFSVSLRDNGEEMFTPQDIPKILEPYVDLIDVIINLHHVRDHVHLELVKDHEDIEAKDMNLQLDPKTLLIAEG
ncbi:MAG: hypothetical protein ACLFNZ_09005 [Spirochaetaceae bacterium]